MDKTSVYHAILEMLVKTQFAYWVDSEPKTAEEINTQEQRAIDYYLGQPISPQTQLVSPEQLRFRAMIEKQCQFIMQIIDKD